MAATANNLERPIRFLRSWMGRKVGQVENGLTYGVRMALIARRIAEWDTGAVTEGVTAAVVVDAPVVSDAVKEIREARGSREADKPVPAPVARPRRHL